MRVFFSVLAVFVTSIQAVSSILGLENAKAIPGSYIVVLKKGLSSTAISSHLSWADGILNTSDDGATPKTFDVNGFRGYTIRTTKSVASMLAESDQVRSSPNPSSNKKRINQAADYPRSIILRLIRRSQLLLQFPQSRKSSQPATCRPVHHGA